MSAAPPAAPVREEDRLVPRAISPGTGRVIAIGGTGSNAGKTWLAEATIRAALASGRPVTAIKVTRAHTTNCPREIDACGVCDSLAQPFELINDPSRLMTPGKDTWRYGEAGASGVLWLLVDPAHLLFGLKAAVQAIPPGHLVVAEGNSFIDGVVADASVLVVGRSGRTKDSAKAVWPRIHALACRDETAIQAAGRLMAALGGEKPVLGIDEAPEWLLMKALA